MAETLEFTLEKVDEDVLKQHLAEQDDSVETSGPFHGQQGAIAGGYAKNPEYRSGMLSWLGIGDTVDRMETPITEEEKTNPIIIQAVESDVYQALDTSEARQEFLVNAVQENNLAIQESVGEPLVGGDNRSRVPNINKLYEQQNLYNTVENEPDSEAGVRVQKGNEPVNADWRSERGAVNQPVSHFVPDPRSGTAERVIKGGIMQAVRGVASVPEYLYDRVGLGDPTSNSTYGAIPVMPAASETEKMFMDITEVIAGAASGGALVKGMLALPGLAKMTPALAEKMGKVYTQMRKSPDADWALTFDKYLKSVLVGSGIIAGETSVLVQQDADPLVGDWALGKLGMDEGEVSDYAGHAIDSLGINTALVTVGKLIKWTWGKGKGFVVPKGLPDDEQLSRTTALLFLKKIDPSIDEADEPLESLIFKARAMADVLSNNAVFKNSLSDGADISLDSAGAVMMGAEEYFRRAYAWKAVELGEAGFTEFVTKNANDLISNVSQLKKSVGMAADPEGIVTSATANINRQIGDTLGDASEEAIEGGTDAAQDFLSDMVNDGVDALNRGRGAVRETEELLSQAQSGLTTAQEQTVTSILKNNAEKLGSTADEVAALNEAAGEQLLISFTRSKESYDAAFSAITKDIPVDYETFIPKLQKIFAKEGSLDFITTTATREDPIAMFLQKFQPKQLEAATDNTPAVFETFEQIVKRIEIENPTLDLKEVYTTLRPQMSARINALEGTDGSAAIPYLTQVKTLIDDLVSETGDESFDAAKLAYSRHEGVYGAIPELAQWEVTAGRARVTVDDSGALAPQSDAVAEFGQDSFGRSMGQGTAIRDAVRLLDNALADETGITAQYITRAWAQAGENITPEIADNLLAKTLRTIDTSDPSKINSQALIQTLMPTRTLLESMGAAGQATLARFDDIARKLQAAEQGSVVAREALEEATTQLNKVQSDINESVASRFIFNIGGDAQGGAGTTEVAQSIGLAVERLFKDKNAPNLIENLLKESDDPRLLEGMQSLVLKHLKNKMYTASELAPNSNVASIAQLGNILEDGDNTLALIRQLFKDTPETAQGIVDLLNLQKIMASGRAYKSALTVGSETVENASNAKKIDRLVMFTLGILNPMATKARAIGRAISNSQDAAMRNAFDKTQAALMSNPQYFSWALNNAENLTPATWRQGTQRFLGRQAARQIFGDQPTLSEENQMYEAFGEDVSNN